MITRRTLLKAGWALALLPACGHPPVEASPNSAPADDLASTPDLLPTLGCDATDPQVLGPFYREGTPERDALFAASEEGEPLLVSGVVRAAGTTCAPLDGVLLDVWQADAQAVYDMDDPDFRGRARLRSGAGGLYTFESILPGRYLNGAQLRPRHIHVKLSHPGYRPITTQLYFAGDPYLADDPFAVPSLVMPVEKVAGVWRASLDLALAPV